MPQPNMSQVHIDAPLTFISTAYIQDAAGFVSTKMFPIVPVEKKSDLYYKYTKDDWFRDEAKPRAPGTESAGSGYGIGNDNYSCTTYAFHKDVDDQTRANTDNPLNPDRDATEFVTQRMPLRQEKQWADDNFKTGVWATDKVGGTDFTLWSDYAGSNPINDIELGKRAVLVTTGYKPNKLLLGYDVYIQLKNHPDFVDRVKYTGGVNEQVNILKILAQLFALDEVHVAESVINTAAEGAAGVYSFVHGKNALLCYVPKHPGLMTPAAGYQFMWKGVSRDLGTNVGVKRFRMEQLAADRIEAEMAFTNKVVGSDLGYFYSAAVA